MHITLYPTNKDIKMKFKFVTLGCKLNFAESSAIGKALIAQGHQRVGRQEQADVCIINTCTVTDHADQKDRQAIHRIRRENPNATLIVTGCYAQLNRSQEVRDKHASLWAQVDYIVGQDEKSSIPDIVAHLAEKQASGTHTALQVAVEEPCHFNHAVSYDDRTRCFLKVQDGCNYFCSYCTIPFARGRSRNPAIKELVVQATSAIEQGAKELVLTGVNIGDFGRSTNEDFVSLLKALDEISCGEFRIRIGSCEPNLLTEEIIDFVAQAKHFTPHFHIPLQSGSNRVLKIMGRRYTRELFAQRVAYIRSVLPDAFIGVDCMVGVRGEDEACYQEYLEFIRGLPVSQLHVFTYSERANTRILKEELLVVPHKQREARSSEMRQLSDRKTQAFYEQNLGKPLTILWESNQCKINGVAYMSGFSENYIKVSAPYDKNKINTFETITLAPSHLLSK